jgi:hypothetical protein
MAYLKSHFQLLNGEIDGNQQNLSQKDIGQTWSSFEKRFQEHLRDYKDRNGKSKFAQHLLDNEHSIGPMEDVMKILYINIANCVLLIKDTIDSCV